MSSSQGRAVIRGRSIDFTRGGIIRNLVLFSIPLILGELLQTFYNSCDAIVVGNFVSASGLAAISACEIISQLLVNFFTGMSVGTNVVVSRAFGNGNEEALKKAVRVTFSFSTVLGVVLSLLGILASPLLLRVAHALPEYYDEALGYLRVYLAGLMFMVIYNNGAGILRAVGDARTPFLILVFTGLLNCVLDVFNVVVLKLGVTGTAWSTIFSEFLSVVLVMRKISKDLKTKCLDLGEMYREGKGIVISVCDIGMSAGVQIALVGFSNIFVLRYMNLFDTASVAGMGIATRIDKFIGLPAKSFGVTMTTCVSQNIGAGRYSRVKEGMHKCMALAVSVTAAISLIIAFSGEFCVRLFNRQPEVVRVGVGMMYVLIPFFVFMAMREVLLGILRGYGKSRMPMILSLIGMIGVRQLYLAVTMHRKPLDIRHIYICYPLAWVATFIMIFCYYLSVKHEFRGLNGNTEDDAAKMALSGSDGQAVSGI